MRSIWNKSTLLCCLSPGDIQTWRYSGGWSRRRRSVIIKIKKTSFIVMILGIKTYCRVTSMKTIFSWLSSLSPGSTGPDYIVQVTWHINKPITRLYCHIVRDSLDLQDWWWHGQQCLEDRSSGPSSQQGREQHHLLH